MNENNKNSYFLRHRTSTIIVVVLIFVVAGILIWGGVNNKTLTNQNASKDHVLTQAQIQNLIETGSAKGPDTITGTDKTKLVKSGSANGTSTTLTADQMQTLINSGTAK